MTNTLSFEGVQFEFVGYEGDEFCSSSFTATVSHRQWVGEAWGANPSPLEYALFASREDPCWGCPSGSVGCAVDGVVSTTRLPDRHELAHAAHGSNCSSLLEEGWATIYGDPFENRPVVGTLVEAMEGIAENGRLGSEHYPLAGQFIAFLVETYGMKAVRDLCVFSLPNAMALDEALLEVLGKSLADVQTELDAYPPWSLGQLRQDQACENAGGTASPGPLTLELGCKAGGVEGEQDGQVLNQGLLELPEGGPYTFEFAATEELEMLWIELRNCEREGMASVYYDITLVHPKLGAPAVVLDYDFLPGVYVVRAKVQNSEGTSPDLTVEVSAEKWP